MPRFPIRTILPETDNRGRSGLRKRGPATEVSVQSLQKQLAYEWKHNRKKVVLLGLLVVVGMYFWAPLLVGGGSSKRSTASSGEASAENSQAKAAAAGEEEFDWKRVAKLLAESHWQHAASPESLTDRSPFGDGPTEEVEPEPEFVIETTPADPVVITPQQVGISLTSTIVGGKKPLALVNGRVYQQGETIDAGSGVEFVVWQVQSGRVVLVRDGKAFELTIPAPGSQPAANSAAGL